MKHNIGYIDRIVRVILGLALFTLYFMKVGAGSWDNYFLAGGGILLMTSARRCCPLYMITGIGTCGNQTTSGKTLIKVKKMDLRNTNPKNEITTRGKSPS